MYITLSLNLEIEVKVITAICLIVKIGQNNGHFSRLDKDTLARELNMTSKNLQLSTECEKIRPLSDIKLFSANCS